jgi:hypothetical protein
MLGWQRKHDPKKASEDEDKWIEFDLDAINNPSATTEEVLLGLGVDPDAVMRLYAEVEVDDQEHDVELEEDIEEDDETEGEEGEEQVENKSESKPKAAVSKLGERSAVPAAVATGTVFAIGVGVALVRRLLRRSRRKNKQSSDETLEHVNKCVLYSLGCLWCFQAVCGVGCTTCRNLRLLMPRVFLSGRPSVQYCCFIKVSLIFCISVACCLLPSRLVGCVEATPPHGLPSM